MVMCSSCSTIRFGRSTTVTIETEHPGDVVSLLAIGPKNTVEVENVTLPYKFKAKHNNLPLRVDIASKNYIYDPFTIGAVRKGELASDLGKYLGWIGLGCTTGIDAALLATEGTVASEVLIASAPCLGLSALLLTMGYTSKTDIPDSKSYLTSSVPVDSTNQYQLQTWYLKSKALSDIYYLIGQGDYKLSRAKSEYLLNYEKSSELLYLKGMSNYYLGKHKDALKDLKNALYADDGVSNPGLREEIINCIEATENAISIKKEQRAQKWANIAGSILETSAMAYSQYVQYKNAKDLQNSGISPSGVVTDPSKLSKQQLDKLVDPYYVHQQAMAREYADYMQFCRYNKKSDGSDYSFDEWWALKGAALLELKEQGYDVVAEQRQQYEENKRWMQEQRKKDKQDWFAAYGYDISDSQSNSSYKTTNTSNNSVSQQINSSNSNNNSNYSANNSSTENNSKDSKDYDSKQQFKSKPVASDDYQKIKNVDLYIQDGGKFRKMFSNVELCRKGAYYFIKIGNKYYPRQTPNTSKFNNAIIYADKQLYYND